MDELRITPSRWYYVLAGLIFVAGWIMFAGLLYKNLSGMGSRLQQVVVPGQTDVILREPGDYTIFYERRSVVGNKMYATNQTLSGLACALVSKTQNAEIVLTPSSTNSTYEFGGRSGRSMFDFRISQPGVYTLSGRYPQGQLEPQIVLAVGKDFNANLFTTIFESLALVFGSSGIAIAIIVVTAVKRSKNKKRPTRQAWPIT